MDKQTATQLISGTFDAPFDEGRFRNFAINLLNDVDESKAVKFRGHIKHSFLPHIKSHRRLGTYTDPNGDKIDVLVVQLKNEWALERSRTMLRNFTADYLKNRDEKDAALVAYYTTNPDDWRFSYIRMEYKRVQTDSGKFKIKEDVTPAKRYSFLVGNNEPNHTAQAQLVGILSDDKNNPTLSELETAFSVDAVTKQFYKDYRAQFEKLWNELNDIVEKDPKIAQEFETKTIDTANFAKKLMGQIVFLYFLQKKGWLGVGKDENGNFEEWGTGPKNFLHRLFKKEFTDYGNFFNEVLEPLFYEGLASEHEDDYFSVLDCKVPFLNGGLFEPMNGYNWRETDIRIDNDLIGDVFKTFDQYNFTVREDEPLEKEVAVDPEMLGKVFENLLPENLRKGKGAYYTPRTIVHYMCQESLINYLDSVSQASLLENTYKTGKKNSNKQDACDTIYFDYESLTDQRKRNLPHWEQDEVTYFVNFRLWDSIPSEIAENIRNEREEWKRNNKIDNEEDLQQLNIEKRKEYYRLFSKRIDDLLDNGHGSCILKNPDISIIVEEALEHFNGERYQIDHWVIMPNHVHVIVKPINNWTLSKITHSWKSFTANEINKVLERDGQLWMHESFDHIVRSPEQLQRLRKYIAENPKNLPKSQYRIKSNPTFQVEKEIHNQDDCGTIPKEDIKTLIREGDIILELETAIIEQGKKYDSVLMPSIKDNAKALDDALANIKVCDPAIGSGAFPVGMLNEIVKARNVLSLYLDRVSQSSLIERDHKQDARDTYNFKRHCIQNSLYGVDIDPGAIEIAKLRLWLSLVVDEDDYTTIQPLPNLDYKIMQGNSLIEEFHGISLDIEKKSGQKDLFAGGSDLDALIDDLHQKQDDFFNAEHPREKKEKREAVETAIYNIFHNELEKKKSISALEAKEIETDLKEMTHGHRPRTFFPWHLYFADIFREKGGFDIMIGNPPWEKFKPLDPEFFERYFKEYRVLSKSAQKLKREELLENSKIKTEYDKYLKSFKVGSKYFKEKYDLQGSGDLNLYKLFLELVYNLSGGTVSFLIPGQITVDKGCMDFRREFLSNKSLWKVIGLNNRKGLFLNIDNNQKFVMLFLDKNRQIETVDILGWLDRFMNYGDIVTIKIKGDLIQKLDEYQTIYLDDNRFNYDFLLKLNKNDEYRSLQELSYHYWGEYHVTNDSHYFDDVSGRFPLSSGKAIDQYDCKAKSWLEKHGRSSKWRRETYPKSEDYRTEYYVSEIPDRITQHHLKDGSQFRIVIQTVTGAVNNVRTLYASCLPKTNLTNNSLGNLFIGESDEELFFYLAILNSFVVDWQARMKVATNLNKFILDTLFIPVYSKTNKIIRNEITELSIKLSCVSSAFDELTLECFGKKSDDILIKNLFDRQNTKNKLDSMVAKLFELSANELENVLSTFPLVKREIKNDVLRMFIQGSNG